MAEDVTVGIVAQRDNERAHRLAATLVDALERQFAVAVAVDELTGEAIDVDAIPVAEMEGRDLVASIGGDGTLLFVAREIGSTPLVGVNLGEVGFLNAVHPDDARAVVTDLVETLTAGESLTHRDLRRLQASGEAADWTLEPALNEILVHGPRRGPGSGVTAEIRVDGERYTASHADGVLVSTPTGSSAYNLSEGGPLVRPAADALVITQMAATDPLPPLVVDTDTEVTLSLSGPNHGYVISDGRNRRRLELPATVSVAPADEPVWLVGPEPNFFAGLEKLG
ncbi:NAD(+)/NADH kinase [Natronobacterium gregoryi]|uniref:NAD kinase n=2 Tax=Natronobacterium gregoryi TaxID=44930 RepID=L0AES5_NATGS|nr:NAD(+)/NADH kinase [Natronobacterium gregoryi]AFZ72418.1 putative sugar kinase [Natronobacterium gregoryi SP2]ELY64677.1 ATP-NAD/AcoX kinase [Natronobacterium gregoryi SP2]PLK19260.1 NAD(+) kinase [Natronobacterium gregoryi SP2]SFJ56119.1 NAD+ kinase [Natronobacterium gregoryi]